MKAFLLETIQLFSTSSREKNSLCIRCCGKCWFQKKSNHWPKKSLKKFGLSEWLGLKCIVLLSWINFTKRNWREKNAGKKSTKPPQKLRQHWGGERGKKCVCISASCHNQSPKLDPITRLWYWVQHWWSTSIRLAQILTKLCKTPQNITLCVS